MIALLVALWLAVQAAAPLDAVWEGNTTLIVTQGAPGCLYLTDPWVWIGCDAPVYRLPIGGVDQAYNPEGRTLVLRDDLAQTTTARLQVPGRVFIQRLVLVVRA